MRFFIAYEEQCVHSIVANDMLYIKEQFDLRHYRREHILSEYKKQDKMTEKEIHHPKQHKENHAERFDANENIYNI